MDTRIKWTAWIAVLALALLGCQFFSNAGSAIGGLAGSGQIVTEARSVSNFHAVRMELVGNLTITQGDEESLSVSADDNLIRHIVTEVKGGVLTIRYDTPTFNLRPSRPIEYKLAVKELDGITLGGSGSIQAAELKGDKLALDLSGSGEINLERVELQDLRSTLSGSGTIRVAGTTDSQNLDLSGSGEYQADGLESKTADLTLSGSGQVECWVNDTLTANISGSGSVSYYGNPKVNSQTSGSGRLVSRGNK